MERENKKIFHRCHDTQKVIISSIQDSKQTCRALRITSLPKPSSSLWWASISFIRGEIILKMDFFPTSGCAGDCFILMVFFAHFLNMERKNICD